MLFTIFKLITNINSNKFIFYNNNKLMKENKYYINYSKFKYLFNLM